MLHYGFMKQVWIEKEWQAPPPLAMIGVTHQKSVFVSYDNVFTVILSF